ncbi:MAG: LysR family transcriptional regulator [Alloalcanivorax venustensis]|jgi:DNA-binding transcriptional LysR family regulator|uniref:LysR family transcriptional regulator n=1 Tax=Alloalcanivorax venustensis ISO4 TaxID=1177184 RepID=A0ABS0ALB0_9GAMM|nr:LysR family transcriptional regulator [Alloalcanivorax venustensis]MAQ34722.1 LysR family transcriptional regulator [Alcanivorax sp.]MEC8879749.1 LysR family transcriptional regulator [Pseudomonadota bacterium]MBF49069.1 LysR family transcriptional regulator [Alcanivorax sp.]MBF5054291.1 LysR family transcriptional regulator [Alloalcanivorax venustensis ISO4]MBT74665.1 LysR family transcriptional regulator [Alcanivorax sp.]|tara:strand:+ start:58805 stop:59674 length:870 start_codon:yes stop_codon:yes gene_type:complete
MDTQALTAFLAVAESGSFSTAAERLFLTQPAVSKRIAQLEQQLGTRLFDRVGRRIRLTEAGEALLPRARQVLLDLEDMSRAISNLTGTVSGTLRIGTSHHIGLHRLPPVLRRFSREYPDVKLDIHFIDSEEAWEAVLHGDLEMGVVTLPPQPDPRLHSQAVWQDPLVFMAAPEHPLARLDRVTLETLTGYSAILPSPVTFTRRIVESLFEEQALTLNISMSTNYLETIHMMVSIGLGWSVLPETMLDDSVVRLNVDTALPVRRLGVVTHPGRSRSNAAGAFLDILNSGG